MAKTLFELLKDWWNSTGPLEFQVSNPLKIKLGMSVQVKEIDYEDLIFHVKRITEYKRTINGKEFVFTDYDILAKPLDKEDVNLKLRLMPLKDGRAGMTHNVLLLTKYYEQEYSKDFHAVLEDTKNTKVFEASDAGVVTERYFRVNDVTDSYKPVVTSVSDETKYASDLEKTRHGIEYWDFNREIQDEAGQNFIQYLFAELDSTTGYIQLFQGKQVDLQQVSVL